MFYTKYVVSDSTLGDIFTGNEIRGFLEKNPHFIVLALFRTPLQNPPHKFFCNLLEKG